MSAPQPAHKARKENRMKNCNASEIQITRRILPIACATALAVACTASLAQSVQGGEVTITPPPVPANIQVPLGNTALDRKSTRLNSSHTVISYAVFCLK